MATRQLLPSRDDLRLLRPPCGPRRLRPHWLVLGLVLSGLGAVWPPARAAEPEPKLSDVPARPFLAQYCQGCHAGERHKGKFRLETLTGDFNDKVNRERWLAVS